MKRLKLQTQRMLSDDLETKITILVSQAKYQFGDTQEGTIKRIKELTSQYYNLTGTHYVYTKSPKL